MLILSDEQKLKYLTFTINPLLISILVSSFFLSLADMNPTMNVRFKNIAQKYQDFGVEFLHAMDNKVIKKEVIMDTYYPIKETLIELWFENKEEYIEFLVEDDICEILLKKWVSSYDYDYNIFATSTAFRYLSGRSGLIRDDTQ